MPCLTRANSECGRVDSPLASGIMTSISCTAVGTRPMQSFSLQLSKSQDILQRSEFSLMEKNIVLSLGFRKTFRCPLGFIAYIAGYGIWNGSDIAIYHTDKCIFFSLFHLLLICEMDKIMSLYYGKLWSHRSNFR